MAKSRTPQQGEQEPHRQAFELYVSLGERRTYREVASKLSVAERTVRHWARQGNWRQRLQERTVEEARRLADQTLETTVAQRGRNRKIVEMALIRLAKAVAEGKVRMQLGDIERLIRLQADLERMDVADFEGRNPREIMASFFRWYGTLDRETRQWAVDSLRGRVVPSSGTPPRT